MLGSPELSVIFIVSVTGAKLKLQSRMSTINLMEPLFVEIGGFGYTSEYHELGVPAPDVQLEFPEVLLANVTLGL